MRLRHDVQFKARSKLAWRSPAALYENQTKHNAHEYVDLWTACYYYHCLIMSPPRKINAELHTGPTEYPASFPQDLKDFITDLMSLLGASPPDIGKRLATDFFTPTGELVRHDETLHGSEGTQPLSFRLGSAEHQLTISQR